MRHLQGRLATAKATGQKKDYGPFHALPSDAQPKLAQSEKHKIRKAAGRGNTRNVRNASACGTAVALVFYFDLLAMLMATR